MRSQPADGNVSSPRPNLVLILVNNLRWDESGYAGHPFLKTPNLDRLAGEGARFSSAFVTTPDEAASFAGLLTGRHPAGVAATGPTGIAAGKPLPQALREAGYRTFFAGPWPLGDESPGRLGFSTYESDLASARVVEFIGQREAAPFCAILVQPALQPTADRALPLPITDRHRQFYANDVPRRRPGPDVLADPHAARTARSMLNEGASDEFIRNRWRAITAIDESIGRIYETLQAAGQLDRTVIVVTGDRGFLYGEHGVVGPGRSAHEESIRIPLVLRYPPVVKRGVAPGQLVLNIDLAPTVLELAGRPIAPTTSSIVGVSLVALLRGEATNSRFSFMIEGSAVPPGGVRPVRYQAVRTPAWKYIKYLEGEGVEELYDFHADHYELINLAGRRTAKNELRRWSGELAKVLKAAQ